MSRRAAPPPRPDTPASRDSAGWHVPAPACSVLPPAPQRCSTRPKWTVGLHIPVKQSQSREHANTLTCASPRPLPLPVPRHLVACSLPLPTDPCPRHAVHGVASRHTRWRASCATRHGACVAPAMPGVRGPSRRPAAAPSARRGRSVPAAAGHRRWARASFWTVPRAAVHAPLLPREHPGAARGAACLCPPTAAAGCASPAPPARLAIRSTEPAR